MNTISLDLKEEQEKAYHSLLAFGQLSIGEFCFYNNLEVNEGQEILKTLEEKGLASPIKGLTNRYIPKFPFLNIAEKFKEPVDKFKQLTSELDSFFSSKEKEVRDAQEVKIKEINDAIDPKIKELHDNESNLKKEVEKSKSEFNTELNQIESGFKTKFDENKNKSSSDFNSKKSKAVETAFTKSTEKKEVVLQDLNDYSETITSISDDFFTNIDNSIQLEIQSNFETLKHSIETLKNEIEEYQREFSENTVNFVDKSLTDSEIYLNNSKDKYLEAISVTKDEIVAEKEALGILDLNLQDLSKFEAINSNIKQPLTELRHLLLNSKNEINTLRENFNASLKELLTSDKDSISKTVEDAKSDVNSIVSSFKDSVSGQSASIKSLINEKQETNIKKTDELFSGFISSLKSFQQDWISNTKSFSEQWVSIQNESQKSQESTISETNTKLTTALDKLNTNSKELRDSLLSDGTNLNQDNSQNLDATITESTSHIVKVYDSIVTEQDNNLTKLIENNNSEHEAQLESLKGNYQKIKEVLETFLNNISATTNEKLETQDKSLASSSEKVKSVYAENKTKLSEELNSKQKIAMKGLDEKNSGYYDEMLFLQNTMLNDVGQIVEEFQTNLSDLTLNQMKELLSTIQNKFNYVTGVQNLITTSIKGFIAKENEIRGNFSSGITEQANLIQSNIKDHVSEIETLVKVGEELLTPSSTLLQEFDKIIKEYDYPKVISSSIIGWAGSISQVHDMIGAMKSRVTLLIPNPSDIPLEAIEATKRTKRVDLSSQFDFNNNEHKTIAKRIVDQDNVTLRNIAIHAGGSRSEFPPFLACDIDGEEVMFGTHDPSNKTAFVGMVSQNEGFVQLMGKVVLSDFLSRAKKVSSGEL